MRGLFRSTLIVLLASVPASAVELVPFVSQARIGVVVRGAKFPDTLHKDLTSGLTNRLLLRIELLANSQPTGQKAVEIAVKYDLWDETFALTTSIDGAVVETRTFPNIEDVDAVLKHLRLTGLFSESTLQGAHGLSIRADLLLNPIDRERMATIRRWVRRNSIATPLNPAGFGAARPAAAPTSNAIFNKIFEQYAAGMDMAAVWQERAVSRPFELGELPREK